MTRKGHPPLSRKDTPMDTYTEKLKQLVKETDAAIERAIALITELREYLNLPERNTHETT